MKDVLDLTEFTQADILAVLNLADDVKKHPEKYATALSRKTLLMIFEKPSLRTRISFEVGMTQMSGHAIYYDLSTSPMGKKESIGDTAKTASRYVDVIMARLFSHEHIIELAEHATVPVINALTNFSHPCQILADLQTMREKKGKLKALKLAYLGDGNNNVTHSLLIGCSLVGMHISVGSPAGKEYEPQDSVVEQAKQYGQSSGSTVTITDNAQEAIANADIVYTDSWMSYHIPKEQEKERIQKFMPYQINNILMKYAKKDALFMNCLPAQRGMEQTAEVIDGQQSIVFDQAENRLHIQKALLLKLLKVV